MSSSLFVVYYSSIYRAIYLITFLRVSSGLLVLWVPLKIYKYFFFPLKELYKFSELILSISLSSSPFKKIIIVSWLIFFISSMISNSSRSYPAFSWISERSFLYTHGKIQHIRQLGTYFGAFYFAFYLQSSLKEAKEESATIIGAFPYFKAVAAPILRPHITTLNFWLFRKFTTVSTCYAYLTPSVMVSPSWLLPHPIKSKDANEKRNGRYLIILIASTLEEELPCR